ncbi:CRE-DAF-8 protein [Caenorhabditis remanei]|uniref:CRE-DAF-8 protein n=1 Tax=Caenorhabditis remanei TaxID=31234 RepID=E3LV95_CAERE|nr:CRE-DAF-8 protein [Caenorhabditis remanei]
MKRATVIGMTRTRAWAVKAVKNISRQAKKNNCFDVFFDAVIHENPGTRCCKARNDKIAGANGRLIILILRCFRFSHVRYDSQIKSMGSCRYQFDSSNRTICMNPWHYKLTELPKKPVAPIVVNKNLDYGEPPVRMDDPFEHGGIVWEQGRSSEEVEDMTWMNIPNVTIEGDEIKNLYDRHALETVQEPGTYAEFNTPTSSNAPNGGPTISSNGTYPNFQSPVQSPVESPAQFNQQNGEQMVEEELNYRSGMSSPASYYGSPRMYPGNGVGTVDEEMMEDSERELASLNRNFPRNGNGRIMVPTYPNGRPITPIEHGGMFRGSIAELGELARLGVYECVEYEERANWLGLGYYEEGLHIGEPGSFRAQNVLIDGFTSTEMKSTNRFSVGFYTNPKRSQATSEVRSLIGRGVRLYLLGGECYAENLCNVPVFIQSISANLKNNFPMNTVSKLPPNGTMKLFDMYQFSKQLALAAERTYNDVHSLSRMCTIRMSFVKGWGEAYRRKSVIHSPVWVQIQLNNPMQWIDSVLTCMGAPPRQCSSRT